MSEKIARKKVFDFSERDDREAFVVLIAVIIYVVGTVVAWFLLWPLALGLTIFAGMALFFAGCILVSDWVKYGEWFHV